MPITNTESKIKFLKAVIISNEKIAGHTYHLKVQGQDIKNIDYTPGMHMKVVVDSADDSLQNIKLRSYSIWDFDSDKGTIDIAVCTHSAGLGTKWIEQAKAGDNFFFFLKKTLTVDDSAGNYFFIGDISTLGHFYKVNRALPEDKKVFSFMYGNETDFFPDINGEKPFDFFVHSSDKQSSAPTELLKEKINSVFDNKQIEKDQSTIVYLGGDARVCADLPPWLMQNFGFKPEQIKMKSFWNPYKVREE